MTLTFSVYIFKLNTQLLQWNQTLFVMTPFQG
jgi:hypothetical protein